MNTFAARSFLKKQVGVKYAQFTALDRPQHISQYLDAIKSQEADYGYSEDFFKEEFKQIARSDSDLKLRIDNYCGDWGSSSTAVGDKASGNVFNYGPLIDPHEID